MQKIAYLYPIKIKYMQKKYIYIAIIAIVAIGMGAFYGGMRYEKNKLMSSEQLHGGNGQFQGGNGQGRQRAGGSNGPGGNNGSFATGQIISKDSNSITVKTQDGGSKIIYFSDSTSVGKTAAGSSSDLSNGEQVMINGTANSNGSITAQNIQIRPAQPNQPNQQ